MANWTPMTLTLRRPLTPPFSQELAQVLFDDHPLPPKGCRTAPEITSALENNRTIEWEDAGVAAFSSKAIELLRSAQCAFEVVERDGFGGPGTLTSFDPRSGALKEIEFEGDLNKP
jgi:hypothetical protein